MQRNGAEAFILDLRNNPGGLVRSGLDIARIFLDGPTTIFNVTGREPDLLFADQLTIQQVHDRPHQSFLLFSLPVKFIPFKSLVYRFTARYVSDNL